MLVRATWVAVTHKSNSSYLARLDHRGEDRPVRIFGGKVQQSCSSEAPVQTTENLHDNGHLARDRHCIGIGGDAAQIGLAALFGAPLHAAAAPTGAAGGFGPLFRRCLPCRRRTAARRSLPQGQAVADPAQSPAGTPAVPPLDVCVILHDRSRAGDRGRIAGVVGLAVFAAKCPVIAKAYVMLARGADCEKEMAPCLQIAQRVLPSGAGRDSYVRRAQSWVRPSSDG